MRIGFLSDTHLPGDIPHLWPEVAQAFQGVDLILHGGDIFSREVLDWLERVAPVVAARGNNDVGMEDPRLKDVHVLQVEGWRVGLIHDLEPEDRAIPLLVERFFPGPVDIILSGHTHRERIDLRDGVLHVNPGSPTLPHNYSTRRGTVALLDVERDRVSVSIVRVGEGPLPNPGKELSLVVHRNEVGPTA